MQRWKNKPPGSNWGEFGPDDQRGRMNLVTREKVLQGIAEVKEGISFCLSLPLDYPGGSVLNPRRSPPRLAATIRAGEHVVPAAGQGEDWAKYEGSEAKALGIQNLAEHGAQGRGVMIDLHHHFGRRHLAVGYDELMKV